MVSVDVNLPRVHPKPAVKEFDQSCHFCKNSQYRQFSQNIGHKTNKQNKQTKALWFNIILCWRGGGGGLAVQPSRYKFPAEDIAHTVFYLDIQKKLSLRISILIWCSFSKLDEENWRSGEGKVRGWQGERSYLTGCSSNVSGEHSGLRLFSYPSHFTYPAVHCVTQC